MPLNHQCQPHHGISYACEFLPHNDGLTVNPMTAWQDWCTTALAAGDVMELCKGRWLHADELVLTAPAGTDHMLFRGLGSERSELIRKSAAGATGAVLRVPNTGASRFEGFSAWTDVSAPVLTDRTTLDSGVVWGGQHFSASHVYDVHALGSYRDGAYKLVGPNTNDCTFTAGRLHAWDYSYVPSSGLPQRSALRLVETRNHEFRGMEIHSFVPSGAAVLGSGNISRLTLNGRVWSVTVPHGQPAGMAQARFTGPTRGLLFLNDVLEAEPVVIPGTNPVQHSSHAPTFALYADQGISGLEVRGAELYFHYAMLSGSPEAVFDQVNIAAELSVVPSNPGAFALVQEAASSNPALASLKHSDIYCGGLPVKPAGGIDWSTTLRKPGAVMLYPGATDVRVVR